MFGVVFVFMILFYNHIVCVFVQSKLSKPHCKTLDRKLVILVILNLSMDICRLFSAFTVFLNLLFTMRIQKRDIAI